MSRERWVASGIVSCGLVVIATRELLDTEWSLFARIMLAPVPWIVSFIPPLNIGTEAEPFYEGTPLHIMAMFAAIPISAALYTVLGYVLLTLLWRRRAGAV